MWINNVCSPVLILLLMVIEYLPWSCCTAKISQIQPGIMIARMLYIRFQYVAYVGTDKIID